MFAVLRNATSWRISPAFAVERVSGFLSGEKAAVVASAGGRILGYPRVQTRRTLRGWPKNKPAKYSLRIGEQFFPNIPVSLCMRRPANDEI